MELLLRQLANTDAHAEPLAVVMELDTGAIIARQR
jgi:hypothetical protein